MNNIPIAVSTEDKNSLKNLRSQLKSIGNKVSLLIISDDLSQIIYQLQAALVIRGFGYSRTQKPRITREN
jgi:hypothetical protein